VCRELRAAAGGRPRPNGTPALVPAFKRRALCAVAFAQPNAGRQCKEHAMRRGRRKELTGPPTMKHRMEGCSV